MKVIKEGKWKAVWEAEASCSEPSCGAVVLIEKPDLLPVDYGYDYYAECPICGSRIVVVAKDVPLRLRRVLDKKRKYSCSD